MEIPQTLRLAMLGCALAIVGVWYVQEHQFDLMVRASNGPKGLLVTGFATFKRDTIPEAIVKESEEMSLSPTRRPIREQTEF